MQRLAKIVKKILAPFFKKTPFFKNWTARWKQKPCTGAFGTVDATRPQSGTETQAECIECAYVKILCAIFVHSETVHQYTYIRPRYIFVKEGSKKLQLYFLWHYLV